MKLKCRIKITCRIKIAGPADQITKYRETREVIGAVRLDPDLLIGQHRQWVCDDPVDQYAALRFIAGFGLAGEVGRGITLVSGNSSEGDKRLWHYARCINGTARTDRGVFCCERLRLENIVHRWRRVGSIVTHHARECTESGMFSHAKTKNVRRGDLSLIFGNGKRALKYLCSILIGFPIWFVVGS